MASCIQNVSAHINFAHSEQRGAPVLGLRAKTLWEFSVVNGFNDLCEKGDVTSEDNGARQLDNLWPLDFAWHGISRLRTQRSVVDSYVMDRARKEGAGSESNAGC